MRTKLPHIPFLLMLCLLFTAISINAQNEFVTTWNISSAAEQLTIPTNTTLSYNYTVDWGDGTQTNETGNATHTYTTAGVYTITIEGTFPQIYFNDTGDKDKILTIEQWGDIGWSSMEDAFYGCSNLTYNATDIPDLSLVSNMNDMFRGCSVFNGAIGNWNLNGVTNVSGMFLNATLFNQPLNNWDVSTVTNMRFLFSNTSFNQNIDSWDVSNVINMGSLFEGNSNFNQDISSWNTGNVQFMGFMFKGASTFNQDISGWNTSSVTKMESTFENAIAFDYSLGDWNIGSVNNMVSMLGGSGLSVANYDATLQGWEAQTPVNNITLGAAGLVYCTSEVARENLINNSGWTIIGDTEDIFCDSGAFITTWQSNNSGGSEDNEIIVPGIGTYSIGWEEIGNPTNTGVMEANGTTTVALTNPGTYRVFINGDISQIRFAFGEDRLKILTVESWGDIAWTSMENAFAGCNNLTIAATDVPNLAGVTDCSNMFTQCTSLTGNLDAWDVSQVQSMHFMFALSSYNEALNSWDVGNATDMSGMFLFSNFNQPINNWNVGNVLDMGEMFLGSSFNQDIGSWNVSNVTLMAAMFENSAFNQNLGNWNIGQVQNMNSMLNISAMSIPNYDATLIGWAAQTVLPNISLGALDLEYCEGEAARDILINDHGWTFVGDLRDNFCNSFITTWQSDNGTGSNDTQITIPGVGDYTIYWESTDGSLFGGPISASGSHTLLFPVPGTYRVGITGAMEAINFASGGGVLKIISVDQWGDLQWTTMSQAFLGCVNLNIVATDAPDLSQVSSLADMFRECTSLDADLNHWDTSTITDMSKMFRETDAFNSPLGNWNTSLVQDFSGMFRNADAFNSDIGSWNTASATNMSFMFRGAEVFNQDIGNWDVSSVQNFNSMFINTMQFNQNLGNWDVSSATNMNAMLASSQLSLENYDQTLIGWSALTLQPSVTLGAGNLEYCEATDERQSIIDNFGWSILGDSQAAFCEDFITIWQTDLPGTTSDTQIFLPTIGTFDIYWEEVGNPSNNGSIIGVTGTHLLDFGTAGTYKVGLSGGLTQIFFNNLDDKHKILSIEQWGNIQWASMANAFRGCNNLVLNATDAPDLSNATTLGGMFWDCSSLTGGTGHWDVSNITFMTDMFNGASNFNDDLSTWDVSNVTHMDGMFRNATSFNQDLSWTTTSLRFTRFMFNGASSFNGDLSNWNTTTLEEMDAMFMDASAFNQDITSWDTSNVREMDQAFSGATAFNQAIGSWNTGNVTEMQSMFTNASSFNQPLNNWNVSSVQQMHNMLDNSGISVANYDATLIGWAAQTVPNGITLGALGLEYCRARDARQFLINTSGWTINGDNEITNCGIIVQLRVYLQGASLNPNVGEETLMRDDLRSSLPLVSPYGDGATIDGSVLNDGGSSGTGAIEDNIVDWIWVELRDPLDNGIVLSSQAALLQRDGDMVALDGVSNLDFLVPTASYHVSIFHRNHIAIVTATPVSLSASNTLVDFSVAPAIAQGGTLAVTDMGNGILAMYSGDIDDNNQIQISDATTLIQLVGTPGYLKEDLDMNGQIQITDLNNILNPNVGIGIQF
ncbi:MAG: BspA family leucine-rich repeat surface protein [Flavobacteriaceae bacterium]|nr:BspA family leucine-rich repeat surface protein [Flavobacteriaceae bacterium]